VLSLLIKEISDEYAQENFQRISDFIDEQSVLKPDFKFYTYTATGALTNQSFSHNLSYVPKDIILLNKEPYTMTVTWRFGTFTSTNIYFDTSGAGTFRFLLGRYEE
jgi:hypothetical protein